MDETKLNFTGVSLNAKQRFSARYQAYGYSPLSLGWDSFDSQRTRFEKVIDSVDLAGKSILDIGCGFGDICYFLNSHAVNYSSYLGWDIVDSFISEAINRYGDSRNRFEVCDITQVIDSQNLVSEPVADIAIMLGLLNWNLGSKDLNMEYTKNMIQSAFSLSKELLVVDFLSSVHDPCYPPEEAVFYHNPCEIVELAVRSSPNFKLLHDYLPIPQKEFMLIIEK